MKKLTITEAPGSRRSQTFPTSILLALRKRHVLQSKDKNPNGHADSVVQSTSIPGMTRQEEANIFLWGVRVRELDK